MTVRVKICGVTRAEDAAAAIDAGADLIGLNFVPGTPRCLELPEAEAVSERAAGQIDRVAVFRDAPLEDMERVLRRIEVERVQLHGSESHEVLDALDLPTIKALPGADPGAAEEFRDSLLLLDHPSEGAGQGQAWEWAQAEPLIRDGFDVILAGGLRPENVAEALDQVGDLFPWGVDVSSGVEAEPRVKDAKRVAEFVAAVRRAEAQESEA